MLSPGGLKDLPSAESGAWGARVSIELRNAIQKQWQNQPTDPPLATAVHDATGETRSLEWPAYPARVEACLGRRNALRLLDWQYQDGTPEGRIRHQEEYGEWRVVRQGGRLRAIELTTELSEYWEVLAGYAPSRTLELIAQFAGTPVVVPEALYGRVDPFSASTNPEQRIKAFRGQMLAIGNHNDSPHGPISPYNDGRMAICCMVHRDNNLASLLRLVVSAAHSYLVQDRVTGRTRFPSGSEAIRGIDAFATDGRNSDPLIVERIVRFVTENRTVALDDPIGVYIHDVQHHELAQPDGSDVPADWFAFSRGLSAQVSPDGRSRHQRLKLELPPDADFHLDDLIVRRTGESLQFGGQLAELVQLVLYIRTSPSASEPSIEPADPGASTLDCSDATSSWEAFWEAFLAKAPQNS